MKNKTRIKPTRNWLRGKRINKRGQMMLLNIMICVVCILAAVVMIDPLKDILGIGRTDLGCANFSVLGTGDRMTCIVLDFILPIFFLTCAGVGIAYLGAKQLGGP